MSNNTEVKTYSEEKVKSLYKMYITEKSNSVNNLTVDKYKNTLQAVNELFKLFRNIYGKNWYDNFASSEAFDIWTVNLLEFELQTISSAVQYCVDNSLYGMNIIKFRDICRKVDTESSLPRLNKKR